MKEKVGGRRVEVGGRREEEGVRGIEECEEGGTDGVGNGVGREGMRRKSEVKDEFVSSLLGLIAEVPHL